MIRDPENQDAERLTDVERSALELALAETAAKIAPEALHGAVAVMAKLLRIHDRLVEQMDKARSLLETARDNYRFKGWDTEDIDAWLKDSQASEARPWRR